MGLPIADTWKLVIGPVTVSLAVKVSEGNYAEPVAITDCYKTQTEEEDVDNDPQLAAYYTRFHLWTVKLGGLTPADGDRINHDGKTYTVKRVSYQAHGQRYRCECLENL